MFETSPTPINLDTALAGLDPGPRLFLTIGLPGTGKSVLAESLGEELQCPVIALSRVAHAVSGWGDFPDIVPRLSTWTCDIIGYHLLQGRAVIYDAPNLTVTARAPFLALGRGLNVPVHGFWLVCQDQTLTERATKQGWSPEYVKACRKAFQCPVITEGFYNLSTFPTDPPPSTRSLLASRITSPAL